MKTRAMTTRTVHGCTGLLVAALALAGCAAGTRPPQTQEQLLQRREAVDQRLVTDGRRCPTAAGACEEGLRCVQRRPRDRATED